MRELDFINIINNTLDKNDHLGDDCAYLRDLDIVVTQDSLVEDIHFSRKYSTPYEIGYKSLIVNISDILASGAKPKYITISLSLPKTIDDNFIKDFYTACNDISKEYDVEIVGGDITGAEKIFISVCAIGSAKGKNISSRKNAKTDDYIITTGEYGSSAAGLYLLENNISKYKDLIDAHKIPKLSDILSKELAKTEYPYTIMDTSDGLADALFKIAKASNKTLTINFNEIPINKSTVAFMQEYKQDLLNLAIYGGEDYNLIACVDKNTLSTISKNCYKIIGRVKDFNGTFVKIEDKDIKINSLDNTFNHFI